MNCDDQVLVELLNNTEVAHEADVTQHLERCSRCQIRIEQLAADDDSWSEVAVALNQQNEAQELTKSSSVVVAIDRELSRDLPMQAEHISLDFLSPPSHPEMLGRVGRYDIERLIGAGGMGIVLKAFDTELHRPVAVKVLAPHLAHSGGARQRFAREAQSAAAVVHENVVPIHNVDAAGKLPFLVMQYVPGDSLQGRVDRFGPLSTSEVLRIGAQIANGLAAAHEQGLVHRDVKPGNVLLEESVDRVLISDFGLARAADDASMTRSGVIAGTPHYMSPEQARGESIDTRSDLFSLGSVFYFMCTGHPPFRANGAMGVLHRICNDQHRQVDEVNELVPAALADLIDDLLSKSAAKRPATAMEVSNQLTRLLHDGRSQSRFRRKRVRRKRVSLSRTWIAVTATVLGVILAWGLGSSFLSEISSRPSPEGDIGAAAPLPNAPAQEESGVTPVADSGESSATDNAVSDTPAFAPPTHFPDNAFGVPLDVQIEIQQPNLFDDPSFDDAVHAANREAAEIRTETIPQQADVVIQPYAIWDQEFENVKTLVERAERRTKAEP